MPKAIFLDRDGVVNHDPGDYTKNLSEFHILPDVIESIKLANEKGYLVILITNQAGIAKELYGFDDVYQIHNYLNETCEKNGAKIHDIFFSPYHDGFSKSISRKPDSQMIEKAIHIYKINKNESVMIGDKQRDVVAAEKAGIRGILVETNQSIKQIINQLP